MQWGLNSCGAMLAAGAAGDVNPAIAAAASILDGDLAAGNHALKGGSRALIVSSPEPIQTGRIPWRKTRRLSAGRGPL